MDGNTMARVRTVGIGPRPAFGRLLFRLSLAALVAAAATPASSAPRPAPTGGATVALVELPGHVHRLAHAGIDAGEAPAATPMRGLDLVLMRTSAQQKALDQLLSDQQDPKSARYHHWLSPTEFGRRFGASDAAIDALSAWLKSFGLEVGEVPASRSHLPFSGSKDQVEAAFHTQIHLIDVQGGRHYANVSDPSVPVAVQPLIRSVRGLNDFKPKPGAKPAGSASGPMPGATAGSAAGGARRGLLRPHTYYPGANQYPGYVGPGDFASIYNLTPLYQNNITGAGVAIAIAAQSDLDASVLTNYWSAFGVTGSKFGLPAQSFTSIPVPAGNGGTDPGQTRDGNEDEAYLDSEILGGLAPGAKLILVRDSSAITAAQYVIDQNLAAILNISFGTCESFEASDNATVSSMYQQGVSEGITITVSSSDDGAAACTAQADTGSANDVNSTGFAVNGLASTPYDLAVGGTDFNPNTETSNWSTTNQAGTYVTALSHIPERVWNESCADAVLSEYYGYSDPIAFCNTATIETGGGAFANPFVLITGSGAGLSSCTTTDAQGNCAGGYAQPDWQANVAGIGNFGARSLPDISLIATRWLVCSYENSTCNPANAPSFPPAASDTILVLQGTSASAPGAAAILALLDQTQISASSMDGRQGLINPRLYQIAGAQYASASTLSGCSADQGVIGGTTCVFYDIVSGSNAQPCNASNYASQAQQSNPASTCANEGNASYAIGIMEIGGAQDYAASAGFDIATGLGSINAAALAGILQTSAPPTGLSASASGTSVKLTWHADSSATGGFDVYAGSSAGQESSAPVQQNVNGTTATVSGLQAGQTYYFKISAITAVGVSTLSNEAQATLAPAAPIGLAAAAAGAGTLNLNWTTSAGATTYDVLEGSTAGGESSAPAQSGVSSPQTAFTGLTPGQKYFFKVQAVNAGGISAASAEASGTVIPAVPAGLTATAGNGAVSLSWSAAAGAQTYDIYQGASAGGEGAAPVKTGITSASATVTGLSNGKAYYFMVAAVDAGGASASSAEARATPAAPGGGGGAMDWIGLAGLAALVGVKRRIGSVP
jgi:subtilase family serine protease